MAPHYNPIHCIRQWVFCEDSTASCLVSVAPQGAITHSLEPTATILNSADNVLMRTLGCIECSHSYQHSGVACLMREGFSLCPIYLTHAVQELISEVQWANICRYQVCQPPSLDWSSALIRSAGILKLVLAAFLHLQPLWLSE